MNQPHRTTQWLVWGGLVLTIAIVLTAYVARTLQTRHPPSPTLPIINQVADFSLTNQAGRQVTLADLRGHVWVADIIFTRCAGPCPRMTGRMQELQAALPRDSAAQLVTLTTDADFDTPAVMLRYAARFNADPARWFFLTGDKHVIANLAIDSLKLTALEKPAAERTTPEDLFIHSTIFVLVDRQARLRGVFETEGDDVDWPANRRKILEAVNQLEREP